MTTLLEAVFRLEDDLEARPFLLASGESYRDLLTITAARNVGEFGVIRSHEQSRPLKHSRYGVNKNNHPFRSFKSLYFW